MREYKRVAPASWDRGDPCTHRGRASGNRSIGVIDK